MSIVTLVNLTDKMDAKAQSDEINKALNDIQDKINKTNTAIPTSIPTVTFDVVYTPTFQGFGTPTAVNFFWSRVGNRIKVMGKFTTGTTTAAEARIGLPIVNSVQLVSDSALVASIMVCGIYLQAGASASVFSFNTLIESGVGYVTVGAQSGSSSAETKQNGNAVSGNSAVVMVQFELPVSGWNS